MIRTTNIRTLKDQLSAFLRDVQRGDVILVTDRGRVVAEIRQPTIGGTTLEPVAERSRPLVAAGVLSVGLPNSADAYRAADIKIPPAMIDEALDETRGGG